MAKVQKALPGLARFLGIETQGLLRMDALASVQPVLEVEDYLGPNNSQFVRTTFTALGQDAEVTVPENRFWRMKWLMMSAAPAVAQQYLFLAYIRKNFGGISAVMPLNKEIRTSSPGFPTYQNNVGDFYGFSLALDRLNAVPGDDIGIRLIAASAAVVPFSADLFIQYQELEI